MTGRESETSAGEDVGRGTGGAPGSEARTCRDNPGSGIARGKSIGGDEGGRGDSGTGGSRRDEESCSGEAFTGECICPRCGRTTPHRWGIPCREYTCPGCGCGMIGR